MSRRNQRSAVKLLLSAAPVLSPAWVSAQSVWTGGAGPSIIAWNNPNNWLGGVPPVSSVSTQVFFDGSVSSIQDLGNPFTLNALVFADSVSSVLSGSTINLSSPSAGQPAIIQSTVGNDPLPSSVVRINNSLNLNRFLYLVAFPGYTIDFRGSITANGNPVYLLEGGIYSFNSPANSIEQYQINSGSTALFHNAASLSLFATVAVNNAAARPVGSTAISLGKLVIGEFGGGSSGTATADITPPTTAGSGTNAPFMLVGSVQGNAFNSILNGPMSLGSGTKTFTTLSPSYTLTVNSAISGTGSLLALNTTLKVSGTHTYTGSTTLNNATIVTLASNVLSSSSAFTVGSTSTLDLTGTSQTLSTLNLQGTLNLTNASLSLGTNAASGASAILVGNLIANNSTLIKAGLGTLTFSPSTITSTGPLILDARAGHLVTSLPAEVTGLRITSTLTASIPTATLSSAILSGFGTFIKTGPGLLQLVGASPDFRGALTVSQGSLILSNTLPASLINIASSASLKVDPEVTLSGTILNSGKLTNNGTLTGVLVLQPNARAAGSGNYGDIILAANSTLAVTSPNTLVSDFRFDGNADIEFAFHSDYTSASLQFSGIQLNTDLPLTLTLIPDTDFYLTYPLDRPLLVGPAGTFTPAILSQLLLDTSAFPQLASQFSMRVSPDLSTLSILYQTPPIPEPAALMGLLSPALLLCRKRSSRCD